MKHSVVFTFILFSMFFVSCHDGDENSKNQDEISALKEVGKEIPLDVAIRWMENFEKQNRPQGRTNGYSVYSISAAQLDAMLQSIPELAGVAFHYSIDDGGQTHVVAIPVQTLDIWNPIPGQIITDANTSAAIASSVASAWAKNYEAAYPDNVRFHFFGANIFREIKTISYFQKMEIEQAINDSGVPQLLLIVTNYNQSSTGGRSMDEERRVYDASTQCPPTCNP